VISEVNLLKKWKGDRTPEGSLAAHPKAFLGNTTTLEASIAISNYVIIIIQWSAQSYMYLFNKKRVYINHKVMIIVTKMWEN